MLTIHNSYSRITGLSLEQEKKLRKLMSYSLNSNQAYFSGKGYNRHISLLSKRGDFATGLMHIVLKFIKSIVSGQYTVNDLRVRPTSISGRFMLNMRHTPYYDQLQAAQACVKHHRGIISAVTASGKSVMIALTVGKLQVRTLVVVPSIELKQQLSTDMVQWFGKDKVGKNKDIYIENIQALDPKKPVKGYDCLIIDEFHHSASKSYRNLNKYAWNDIYYRFGFTATAYRSDDNEKLLLESVLSDVIYELDYHTAVANGYIVPVEAFYVEVPKTEVDGITWAQVYSELVVHNKVRNDIILRLMVALKDKPTLCLVKEIAHGNNLDPFLFMSGQDEESRKYLDLFNNGKIKSLVGTTGVLGEGVNTRPAEYIVIAGLGKSKNQFVQNVGRGLRRHEGKESAKIIIFCDKSHKWSLTHFKIQCRLLKEVYGIIPTRLEI